jgi:probable phosphoglycerate mutase
MIYLVRQGETDWNLFRRANGVTDTFLNKIGIAQAKLQAENLRSVNFDACFCSPQTRARQTCEIIYKGPIVFDDRLVEINGGEFEGADETDVEAMKLAWQAVMSGDKGTESFKDFMKRSCDFCDMIVEKYNGKNVLIVTHVGNVRVIDYYFNGKPKDYDFNRRTVIKNGGLLTFENSKIYNYELFSTDKAIGVRLFSLTG